MATRNPTIKEELQPQTTNEESLVKAALVKAAKYIKINKRKIEEDEEEVDFMPEKQITKNPFKKAEIKSVYVEVGANLGSKQLKFGIHADINSEEAAVVKNRLYFECLGSLERHIKEMGSESGPFRSR